MQSSHAGISKNCLSKDANLCMETLPQSLTLQINVCAYESRMMLSYGNMNQCLPDIHDEDMLFFARLQHATEDYNLQRDNALHYISSELYLMSQWFNEYSMNTCQVIYSQFGLAIHQNDHQARRRFVEWAQNEIAVVPYFHKRILFSDEAHFWLNGYVNKQNCRIWSEANPQVYVETPLHPEKLTVWCALWAGGILLQKR
ncbi:hypothetical protein TNCV_3027661 [Trichonephila clavipes]|nr:hypothetical protein TNCV_3027661 [Trichonephila clavipes]